MTAPDSVAEIRRAYASHDPYVARPSRRRRGAATALALRDGSTGPEILLIERATRHGDIWSGHMALPGGKRDEGEDLEVTARRETFEEVGLTLPSPLGRISDNRAGPNMVTTFVYEAPSDAELDLDTSEVAAALWMPVTGLLDPANMVRFTHKPAWVFSGISFEERIIWGLTRSTFARFLRPLGLRIPRAPLRPQGIDAQWLP